MNWPYARDFKAISSFFACVCVCVWARGGDGEEEGGEAGSPRVSITFP